MKSVSSKEFPSSGLGTRKGLTPEFLASAVLDYNYRLIDTAALYENETEIGQGLQEVFKKIPREEIYVISKIKNSDKHDVEGSLRASLKRLQLDYLDLYLIHWPVGTCIDTIKWKYDQPPLHKTWSELETCVRKGLCKSIGFSNFNCQLILDLLTYAEIKPVANEIELHPYCVQRNLVKYCLFNDIQPIAYGPVMAAGLRKEGQVNILNDPLINELSKKYNKTTGQICLQWGIANGHTVIPQTFKAPRLKENMDAANFTIETEDLKKLDGLDKRMRVYDLSMPAYGGTPIFD